MKVFAKKNIARIEVQNSFCIRCAGSIRQELQKIEDIANINLYPDNAMVVFSFFRARELANALNILTELGYPEIGEAPLVGRKVSRACTC
jgi:hypothetical protein